MPVWLFIVLVGGTITGVCVFLGVKFGAMGAVIVAFCCVTIAVFSSMAVLLGRWSERGSRRDGR